MHININDLEWELKDFFKPDGKYTEDELRVLLLESASLVLEKKKFENDKIQVSPAEQFFKTEQIETFVGLANENGDSFDKYGNMIGERRKLIILHQNGENKKELINQLETFVDGLKNGFDSFANLEG